MEADIRIKPCAKIARGSGVPPRPDLTVDVDMAVIVACPHNEVCVLEVVDCQLDLLPCSRSCGSFLDLVLLRNRGKEWVSHPDQVRTACPRASAVTNDRRVIRHLDRILDALHMHLTEASNDLRLRPALVFSIVTELKSFLLKEHDCLVSTFLSLSGGR